MPRYDARARRARSDEEFVDEDLSDDLFPNDDDPESFDLDAPRPSHSIRRPAGRRGRGRDRRHAPDPARGKARRMLTFADVDDDIDALLDIDDDVVPRQRDRKRVEVSEGFKCRHCRNFIGIPPSGGRNRNHCPICLYSLHVDAKTPGDRASDCRSLMQPIGVFYRPKGEQMVVHSCLGCGVVRYNRIAADDNPIVLAELPVLDPPGPGSTWLQGA